MAELPKVTRRRFGKSQGRSYKTGDRTIQENQGSDVGGTTSTRAVRLVNFSDERFVWTFFVDPRHPVLSTRNLFEEQFAKYEYLREQLELNAVRRGTNLVDPERTRHILEGNPLFKTVRATPEAEPTPSASVRGWSGGHANPDAAKYGKTQIPAFWTGERFMYEVSDILVDSNSHWIRQESNVAEETDGEEPPRFVCVEERYGVPIRVVAECVDDEMKCVTAFPDYKATSQEKRPISVGKEEQK